MTVTTSPVRTVRTATPSDHAPAATVLAGAFQDDPVFVWMIPGADDRAGMLPEFFAMFAAAFEPLGASQVVDGAAPDALAGAALWAPPGEQAVREEDAEQFVGRMVELAGENAGRVLETVELLEAHHPQEDCYYLNFVGVDPDRRGRGTGSTLLVDATRRCDAEGQPAYLEATSPQNRRLYERHGFVVVGEITPSGGPSLWPMWREAVTG